MPQVGPLKGTAEEGLGEQISPLEGAEVVAEWVLELAVVFMPNLRIDGPLGPNVDRFLVLRLLWYLHYRCRIPSLEKWQGGLSLLTW